MKRPRWLKKLHHTISKMDLKLKTKLNSRWRIASTSRELYKCTSFMNNAMIMMVVSNIPIQWTGLKAPLALKPSSSQTSKILMLSHSTARCFTTHLLWFKAVIWIQIWWVDFRTWKKLIQVQLLIQTNQKSRTLKAFKLPTRLELKRFQKN